MLAQQRRLPNPVVVLGGCGFLGHHVVKKLLERDKNCKIVVCDVSTTINRIDGVEYITGNITSKSDIRNLLIAHNPEVIFHTVSPNPISATRKQLYDVNVDGTENLLACISAHHTVKTIIYTSSSGVTYNGCTNFANTTEDLPLVLAPDQQIYYSHTKAVAERIILDANNPGTLLTTALRPGSLYGEADHLLTESMIDMGRKNFVIGTGNNTFDFTYVGNAAYAHVLALDALLKAAASSTPATPDHLRVDGEPFFITDDTSYTFLQFSRLLAGAAGYSPDPGKTSHVPLTPLLFVIGIWEWLFWVFTMGTMQPSLRRSTIISMTKGRGFDISKAKMRLGYVPEVGTEEGIRTTGIWWRERHKESEQKMNKKTR